MREEASSSAVDSLWALWEICTLWDVWITVNLWRKKKRASD